eukprot:350266-Chlamydomonas_euryale.AAC.3
MWLGQKRPQPRTCFREMLVASSSGSWLTMPRAMPAASTQGHNVPDMPGLTSRDDGGLVNWVSPRREHGDKRMPSLMGVRVQGSGISRVREGHGWKDMPT